MLTILLAFLTWSGDDRLIGHGKSDWLSSEPYATLDAKFYAHQDLEDKCTKKEEGTEPLYVDYDDARCVSQVVNGKTLYQCDIDARSWCAKKD